MFRQITQLFAGRLAMEEDFCTESYALQNMGIMLLGMMLFYSCSLQAGDLAHIQRTGQLEVCAKLNALPHSDDREQRAGFQVEIAERLAESLDVDLKMSWVQLRWHAKRTKCDAFIGMAQIGYEEPGFLRFSKPYTRVEIVLVKPADGQPINSLKHLAGKTVAVASGTLPFYRLQKAGIKTVERFFSDERLLPALQRGEADVAIVSNQGFDWFRMQNPQLKYEKVSSAFVHPNSKYNYAIGLRRANKTTVKRVDLLLQSYHDDGT